MRDVLNAQIKGWIKVQERANELGRERGRTLTPGEILSLVATDRDYEYGE